MQIGSSYSGKQATDLFRFFNLVRSQKILGAFWIHIAISRIQGSSFVYVFDGFIDATRMLNGSKERINHDKIYG